MTARYFSTVFTAFVGMWAANAMAAIPTEYAGTPYLGTPRTIPGRIDFADVDLGGFDVAWNTDHNRGTDAPQSGDDYRPEDMDLPNICKTNRFLIDQTWSEDFWEDGTTRYPSEADPYDYYLGATHAGDWVRITVDVQQAGTYDVSSNWACDNDPCGLSIWFNDDSGVADDPERPLDGENKTGTVTLDTTGDYHLWREYPSFTTVELSAGLQVMTFRVEIADHLQYSFLQFDLVGGEGGAGGAGGAPAAGGGGAALGGAAPGGAGGMVEGGGGAGGNAAAGSPAVGGSSAGAAANPNQASGGTAGSTAVSMGGSGSSLPTTMSVADDEVDTQSGCAHAGAPLGHRSFWISLAALAAATVLRRRRS